MVRLEAIRRASFVCLITDNAGAFFILPRGRTSATHLAQLRILWHMALGAQMVIIPCKRFDQLKAKMTTKRWKIAFFICFFPALLTVVVLDFEYLGFWRNSTVTAAV